ncbi:MAG: host attachment protein [Hyphomonadaceae bacterium]|nr:host attachment protein [Hyphomonadaceae bacterium]
MTPETVWIVVADGALARFFVRTRSELPLEELEALRITAEEARRLHKHPTAVHDGANHRHHGRREAHDGHDNEERRFLAHIAGRIDLLAQESSTVRFAICAPPRALGVLRDHLSAATRKRVGVEIAKDIVRDQLRDIDTRLRDHHV